ncbi:WhiB family transcriptional regulator [Streptomyces sp. CA-253872]|uniref:WhiB family transcriptional regulator n=1 Tax=Streptomyces sp. CA-253872 TaxID=3240067 RepID=UPI003D8DF876
MRRRARLPAPDTLPRPPHWAEHAACRGADPNLFHPEGDAGAVKVVAAETTATYCASCLVREPCLEGALSRGERWGVWGGLDPEELRALRRRRRERERRDREEVSDARHEEKPAAAA